MTRRTRHVRCWAAGVAVVWTAALPLCAQDVAAVAVSEAARAREERAPAAIREPAQIRERTFPSAEVYVLPSGAMLEDGGLAYRVPLPAEWRNEASGMGAASRSVLLLFEDGRPLGPGNARHVDIREGGGGRFSHWDDLLRFSASDGSDPRRNGRTYEARMPRTIMEWEALLPSPGTYELLLPDAHLVEHHVALTNVGDVPVASPWIVTNGAPDWFTRDSMLAEIRRGAASATGRDLAHATWEFLVRNRYHHAAPSHEPTLHDPVLLLNAYGYGYCDDVAWLFAELMQSLGFPSRVWALDGHVVPEVEYDGRWHMYDPDLECHYTAPDGSVLGVEEIARDARVVQEPVFAPGGPSFYAEFTPRDVVAGFYASADDNALWPRPPVAPWDMSFVLEPGTTLVRSWVDARGHVSAFGRERPPELGGGAWEWTSDVISADGAPWRRDFTSPYPIVAISARPGAGWDASTAGFHAEVHLRDGTRLSWLGEAEARAGADAEAGASGADTGTGADPVPQWTTRLGDREPVHAVTLSVGPPSADVGAAAVTWRVDVQVAPRSLPGLRPGRNELVYRAGSTPAPLRIAYRFELREPVGGR